MATDKSNRRRGAKARQTPLMGTRYTDAELNARVRGFPSLSDIWNVDRNDPVLLNREQPIDIPPAGAEGEGSKLQITYSFLNIDGKVIDPVVGMLRIHLLLRKYKTHVIVKRLKLLADGDRAKERLYGWHLSSHDKRRGVALLNALYGSGAVQFRADACELYHAQFGEWFSRGATSRRGRPSISSNEELLQQFSMECSIIEVLRRALGDAESSASEWPSILSGKNIPSLNKLHRIVNPQQDGVDEMDDDELFVTSIVVSLFGCTNAALVYPKLVALEDVFQVLCFFGRINLGKIWPTVHEAEAFLKYCDVGRDETMPAAVRNIVAVADRICGWTRFRVILAETCRKTIEVAGSGHSYPCRFGRIWPMI